MVQLDGNMTFFEDEQGYILESNIPVHIFEHRNEQPVMNPRAFSRSENRGNAPNSEQMGNLLLKCSEL